MDWQKISRHGRREDERECEPIIDRILQLAAGKKAFRGGQPHGSTSEEEGEHQGHEHQDSISSGWEDCPRLPRKLQQWRHESPPVSNSNQIPNDSPSIIILVTPNQTRSEPCPAHHSLHTEACTSSAGLLPAKANPPVWHFISTPTWSDLNGSNASLELRLRPIFSAGSRETELVCVNRGSDLLISTV